MTVLSRSWSMDAVSSTAPDCRDYLDQLDAALVGPGRIKRGLLDEARDHLEDATEAYARAGYDESEAVALAVHDFGTVDEVAPGFQGTLAVASARRTLLMLVGALAIQPLVWDGPLSTSEEAPPQGVVYAVLDSGVEVFGGIALVTAALLLFAIGLGSRWIGRSRLVARATGVVTIGAALSLKLSGVTMMVASSSVLDPAHWAMLVAFLFVPFSLAATSARRTLAAC